MNTQSQIYVVINPISGTSSKKHVVKQLKKLQEIGYNISIFYTQHPHHATDLAAKAVKEGVNYVVVVGGDGTVNEVARALVGTNTILGIIPHGSGNGLARHLRISMNTDKAINSLLKNNIQKIDYGIANENLFFCTCGVGYDAQVSEKSLHQKKRGIMMYAKNMLDVFRQFDPESYKVTTLYESFYGKAFTITCANASQYGNNAYIAPRANIQDGKMNVIIMKPLSVFDISKMGFQIFTKQINKNPKVKEFISSKVLIEREKEGIMHLDGNAIYSGKNINIKVVRQGLKVLIP